jgi:hypothetical protein
MLPFLALSYPSPLGPAYGVAMLSILTVYAVYYIGSKMVGEFGGWIAALLATISSTLIYFARFSWNPNPAPFVSLLMMYFTYLAWKKNARYWMAVAVCFSILLQLHYITLLMLGGAGFFWLVSLVGLLRNKEKSQKGVLRTFFLATLCSILIVIISFTPLFLFDLKHNWVNTKAFQSIFVSEKILTDKSETRLSEVLLGVLRESHGRTLEVLFTLFFGKVTEIQNFLLIGLGAYLIYFVKWRKRIQNWDGQFLVLIYLLLSIAGISAYKRSIFDHYLLFIVPMSLLFWGGLLANLEKKLAGKLLLVIFLAAFGWFNLRNLPLKSQGWTIYDVKNISDEVFPQLHQGEKYDVVLLSESGDFYALNYRYFLNATNIPPIPYDVSEPVTTLVIINENQKNKAADTIPAYQIQVFGKPKSVIKIPNLEGPNIEIWRK